MTDQLPPPPVPAEVDLRGMEFMPLFGDRLFKSTTWIEADPAAQVAALRLWWHSYAHEVPAASLPDNDRLLAEHAGYGIAVKAFQRIKPKAMRGWTLCSDGRWYHKIVAELALEAWAGRVRNREKIRKWREKKDAANRSVPGNVTVTAGDTEPARNGRERERQRQRQGERELPKEEPPLAAAAPVIPPKAAAGDDLDFPDHLRRVPDGPQAAMASREETDAAFALWLAVAYELRIPDVGHLNRDRREALAARLSEVGGLDGWKLFLEKVRVAEFLRNPDDSPKFWVGLPKLLEPEHFSKVLEDRYAQRHETRRNANGGEPSVADGIAAAFSRRYPAAG